MQHRSQGVLATTMQIVVVQDGVSECLEDDVAVQRVESRMLDGIEQSDYSWCNTDNHRDTERYETLQQQQQHGENSSNDWYQQTMAETRMEKWASVLGHLLVRQPQHVLSISARQQNKYFKPAAKLTKQGVHAKNLLQDEAKELAAELMMQASSYDDEAFLEESSTQGWFVRTSACSPKDAQEDGGAGPHHSLVDLILPCLQVNASTYR